MPSSSPSSFLLHHLLLSSFLFSLPTQPTASTTTLVSRCSPPPTNSSSTISAPYHENLKLLLSSMATLTPLVGAFNSTQGDPPHQVFGQSISLHNHHHHHHHHQHGSTSFGPTGCETCIDEAVREVSTRCPYAKRAACYLAGCAVAYGDRPESLPVTSTQVRSPARRLSSPPGTDGESKKKLVVGVPAVVAVLVLIPVIVFSCIWWRSGRGKVIVKPPAKDSQAVSFDVEQLKKATNNFAKSNRIGVGGFGIVYKGKLKGQKEVAIKRLSTGSQQGIKELAMEVLLLTSLNHENLVKVLGYCLQEDETMLVYEYLPNSSLDRVLNGAEGIHATDHEENSRHPDWATRFKIVKGIAEGLYYLHDDQSHLKVIHRDLKVDNILLDRNMTPKISDFGLARLFSDDQTHANTSRVAGSVGYIAPEYLTDGLYSTRSDVYSYGMMVLEIVTGKRIKSFPGTGRGLPNMVKKEWNKGTVMRALDPRLNGSCSRDQVMACIYVALMCTQKVVKARPDMATVVEILRDPSTSMSRLSSLDP